MGNQMASRDIQYTVLHRLQAKVRRQFGLPQSTKLGRMINMWAYGPLLGLGLPYHSPLGPGYSFIISRRPKERGLA